MSVPTITLIGAGDHDPRGYVLRYQVTLPDAGTFTAVVTVNPSDGSVIDLQADFAGRNGFMAGSTGYSYVDAELRRRTIELNATFAAADARARFLSARALRRVA